LSITFLAPFMLHKDILANYLLLISSFWTRFIQQLLYTRILNISNIMIGIFNKKLEKYNKIIHKEGE
jgi:cbb3-type cytochrome oxidase subunit 1